MKKYIHEMKIGKLALKHNVVSAPLAGLSSLPYRMFAIEMGCALAYSEMVSAEGLLRSTERTRPYFENDNSARPYGIQLFTAKPDWMKAAAETIDKSMADVIDINMGCPVKKVCSKGAGAALMRTPELAEKVILAARKANKLPLTVKIRAGWDSTSINCVEMAKLIEACGADAVILHPRTREQEFKGKSNWKLIAEVKSAVKIPVIGNGDIHSHDDAIRMIRETNCDGVMIGRAAVGNPWIFREIVSGEKQLPKPDELGKLAKRHFEILIKLMGEHRAVLKMRSIVPWYTKGKHGCKAFLRDSSCVKTAEDFFSLIDNFFKIG